LLLLNNITKHLFHYKFFTENKDEKKFHSALQFCFLSL
jgi:hypothetical protein